MSRKYFFTSDTHYFHRNILKYCNRPFADVDEMNQALVENWNRVVSPRDIVFHLGDVAFSKDETALGKLLSQLNGEKHLVEGNHDHGFKIWHRYFQTRLPIKTIHVPPESNNGKGQRIVLCHYAMRVWDQSHFGTWMLYGHSHNTLPDDPNSLSTDVGVDCWEYAPVGMEQLNEVMSKKVFKPLDFRNDRL